MRSADELSCFSAHYRNGAGHQHEPSFSAPGNSPFAGCPVRAYAFAVAAHQRCGFGDPDDLADGRLAAVFLRPSHGKPSYGRAVWETFGSAGSKYRFANPHGSAHPFGDG